MSDHERTVQTPDGWEQVYGPVPSVPTVTLTDGERCLIEGCVTVGNRVRALWQEFGHMLGNGTIVAFERHIETGWIKAVIDYDYPNSYDVRESHDGFLRWDFDRVVLCPGRWDGETQEESVGRWRAYLAKENAHA